jgi:ubiquitin-protein ligase
MSASSFISKQTIQRLLSDIKQIIKSPLTENGIYYSHDETDMLKGYALIIGQSGTPYDGGYYLFDFYFPTDYPYKPPTVFFHTNGENIRFNPNLYKCGKVCISLLNTWSGEQWTSCQTISTVLLTLCTLLSDDPLLNEPGITKTHVDLQNYNKIIEYSNIKIAICDTVNKHPNIFKKQFNVFYPIIKSHFLNNYENLVKRCNENNEKYNGDIVQTDMYILSVTLNYEKLLQKLANCKEKTINLY